MDGKDPEWCLTITGVVGMATVEGGGESILLRCRSGRCELSDCKRETAFEIRAMGEVKSRVSISAREQFLLESAAKNKGDPHGVLAPVVRGMRGELEGVISGVLTGVTYA